MTWKLCLHAGGKALSAAMALGAMTAGQFASAAGPYYNKPNCCPPGYQSPGYHSPGQAPGQQPTLAAPGTETAPGTTSPDANAQTPADQQPGQQQQPDFSAPSEAVSNQANLSNGSNTPMLGRTDVSNRLNLFDNMTAMVRDRVWFGFQYAGDTNAQLAVDPAFASAVAFGPVFDPDTTLYSNLGITSAFNHANQNLYRVGAEKVLFDDLSISVQGQYVSPTAADDPNNNWTNPQIMLKYLLAYDGDSILSATLGITPETGTDRGDVDEATTKIYPGMLFYDTLSPELFTQGGFQFGIPLRDNNVATFDWSLSLGYWLYRDCSRCGSGGLITGIAPQINILGKHVVGDNQIVNPYGLVIDSGVPGSIILYDALGAPVGVVPQSTANNILIYNEAHEIVDLSAGATILLGQHVQIGLGYSIPITDHEARKSEFISSLNYVF